MESIFIFFLIGGFVIFLGCLVLSWNKWKKSKMFLNNLNDKTFVSFKNVKFSTTVVGSFKQKVSSSIDVDIYLVNNKLIIISSRFQIRNYNSKAPLTIDLNQYKSNMKPVFTKSFQLKIENFPYRNSFLPTEFLFTFKEPNQYQRFLEKILNK